MMPTIRRSPVLRASFVLLAIAILIAACAGSGAQRLSTVGSAVGDENSGLFSGGGLGAAAPAASGAAASAAPAAAEGGTNTGTSNGGGTGGDGVGAPIDDAKIVRTGTIDLEVKSVPDALRAARDGIRAMGGYIGASQTQNEGDEPVASITYRLPAARWEDALDLLRGLNGLTTKVVTERTEAVEVTGQVVDLEARIRNLRSSETAFQEIAAKALKVSDVLEVQNQLTQVRGEIEQLTGQLKDLQDRAAFATLTASFRVPIVAVEVAQKGWDPRVVVDEASASLIDVLQSLTTAGIWFAIVWLPILLVLAVIVVAVAWIARRFGLGGGRSARGTMVG